MIKLIQEFIGGGNDGEILGDRFPLDLVLSLINQKEISFIKEYYLKHPNLEQKEDIYEIENEPYIDKEINFCYIRWVWRKQ